MKSKLALGIVGGTVLATTLAWQQRNVTRLADENTGLRQQVAELSVTSAAPPASATNQPELAQARDEHAELLRLRGEVSRLRQAATAAGGTDLAKRLQEAEARAKESEATIAQVMAAKAEEAYSVSVINAGKLLGLAARIFATDNQDRFPTTFDEMRKEMSLSANGSFPGGITPDRFEFFPHERVIGEVEPQLILFREKVARQLQDGTWERIYTLVDGSVQRHRTPDGDFSQIEREGTGTAANAPKKP